MTTTEAKPLCSREQLAGWLLNYDSDVDCRLRALAVLPDARQFLAAVNEIRQALQNIPTTTEREGIDAALTEATELERQSRAALQEAEAAHRRARMELEQATAVAARCRKPMGNIQQHFVNIGRPELAADLVRDELAERGFSVTGRAVTLPEDSDWRKFAT